MDGMNENTFMARMNARKDYQMLGYTIRVQVIEDARREGIAEIEQVREIPEQVILSIDTHMETTSLGWIVSETQSIISKIHTSRKQK